MSGRMKFTKINKPITQRIVSSGRITIPMEFREFYNLKKGDFMEVMLVGFYRNNGGSVETSEEKKIEGGENGSKNCN